MITEVLSGKPLALVLQYLNTTERLSNRLVCKLFKKTLEDPQHDSIFWTQRELCQIPSDLLNTPFIKGLFQRIYKMTTNAVPFPGKHSGFARKTLSFRDMIITCDESTRSASEVKIWYMGAEKPICTATLPVIGSKFHYFGCDLRMITTVQDDWLIRTSYRTEGAENFYLINTWQLHSLGQVSELFTLSLKINLESPSFYNDPAPPVRVGNVLYVLMPSTNEVQVWDLHTYSEPKQKKGFFLQGCVSSLEANDTELIVEYLCGKKRQIINLEDGSISFDTYCPTTSFDYQRNQITLCPEHSTRKWQVLPFPETFNPTVCPPRSVLSSHNLLIGYMNRCHIYTLWNLRDDGAPNYTVTLPVDISITCVHVHKLTSIIATIDGKIWKLQTN